MEHLVFLDSVSFLPFALRKLPRAFRLTVDKSWYPHYFNTRANLEYVGKIPDIYYSVYEMSGSERNEFLAGTRVKRTRCFITPGVLESYSQDVSVLREACRALRREFIHIGNIDVFLESVNIA